MTRFLITIALALHMLPAHAQDKHPLSYPLREYVLLLAVATLGGVVSFYAKVRNGTAQAWNLTHLVGELATSAFAGLIAFWLCEWGNTPQLLTISIVGISGHMGARAISAFEEFAQARWGLREEHDRNP